MEKESNRIAEILVGLSDANVIGVEENIGEPLPIHIESGGSWPLVPEVRLRLVPHTR